MRIKDDLRKLENVKNFYQKYIYNKIVEFFAFFNDKTICSINSTNDAFIFDKPEFIHNNNNFHIAVFITAIKIGNIKIVNDIIYITEENLKKNFIHMNGNWPFLLAIEHNKIDILRLLLSHTPTDSVIHFEGEDNGAFLAAVTKGNIKALNILVEHVIDNDKRQKMIHALGDEAFLNAASRGDTKILNFLIKYTDKPTERQRMIHASDDEAFLNAVSKGNVRILNFLIKYVDNSAEKQKMICKLEYCDYKVIAEKAKTDRKYCKTLEFLSRHTAKSFKLDIINKMLNEIDYTIQPQSSQYKPSYVDKVNNSNIDNSMAR